jgi:cAMP phosphodiesterase
VFNNVIWPDFSRIPTPAAPFIQFEEIQVGQALQIAGKVFEVLPAVHTVPACGYALATGQGCWVFTGDTERNPAFWRRINQMDVAALKTHVFNNVIWPDFSRIPTPQAPCITFHEIHVGETLSLHGKHIEVLPAVHTVPACGYAVTSGKGCWVFTGDTERNPAFWRRINQMNVAALVIETAFSNREKDLAKRSLHLSPLALAEELDCIDKSKRFPIYITHTKPAETELIMTEIQKFDQTQPFGPNVVHDIRWLRAGQEFDL